MENFRCQNFEMKRLQHKKSYICLSASYIRLSASYIFPLGKLYFSCGKVAELFILLDCKQVVCPKVKKRRCEQDKAHEHFLKGAYKRYVT